MKHIQFAPDDDIIDICRDNVFKAAFTGDSPLSQGALKRLVSAFVGRDLEILTIIANEVPVSSLTDRQIRYDIRVKFDNGEMADVEMTLNPHNFEIPRLEYYAARLFGSQDIKGQARGYGDLARAWQIAFVASRRIFADAKLIHHFEFYDPEWRISLGGRIRIIVVELEKAGALAGKTVGRLSKEEWWALFFRYAKDRERRGLVNELLRKEEGIAMAGEVLLSISKDEVERAYLESKLKYELDWQSYMAEARQEGLAEGEAKGLVKAIRRSHQEKLETARKMKQDGLSAEKIREYTQLSPEEIEKL